MQGSPQFKSVRLDVAESQLSLTHWESRDTVLPRLSRREPRAKTVAR